MQAEVLVRVNPVSLCALTHYCEAIEAVHANAETIGHQTDVKDFHLNRSLICCR